MPSSLDSFMNQIQESRGRAPKKLGAMIDDIARKAIEEMSKAAGKFLNEELDENEHTAEQMKAIIELFPDSLSQVDRFGNLPIQNAAMSGGGPGARISVSFVPLMAREGCRLGVGGEGNRGGLLSAGKYTRSAGKYTRAEAIKCLAGRTFKKGPGANEYDRKLAQVLEELRNLNMLMKDDIEDHCLIFFSLHPKCQRRFEFFTSWNPEYLIPYDSLTTAPIHDALESKEFSEEKFEMALKAGMQYFPEEFGVLFRKTYQGNNAIKRAFDKFGADTAMKIIRRCIPPSHNHFVLHRVVNKHAPDLVDDIAQYYPDSMFLRDTDGRILLQSKFYINLRRGRRTFKKQSTFFLEAADDQVNRVDPKTGRCPFMLAAANHKSDLTAVYYLLSRNPKLGGSNEKMAANDSSEAGSSRKRQREDFVK